MKEINLTFAEGFLRLQTKEAKLKGNKYKVFDWDKAAKIIKDKFNEHPDLIAKVGMRADWTYTGGVIFKDGNPTNESYTYLRSNWAIPTLILNWDNDNQEPIECYSGDDSRFNDSSKWDDTSLSIMELSLNES